MDAAAIERELRKFPEDVRPDLELAADDEGASAALFLALGTQWRMAGMAGVLTGLDYAAIEPAARMLSIPLDARRFADLRLMEGEAITVMARRAAAK